MKTRIQKRSKKQELRVAKELGGQVQAGSGSSWRAKGDVRVVGKHRVECKYTGANYYALKTADILKIQEEALLGGLEQWAMQVEFVESASSSKKVAVVSRTVLIDLWLNTHRYKVLKETSITAPAKSYLFTKKDVQNAGIEGFPVLSIHFNKSSWGQPVVPVVSVVNWYVYTDLLERSNSAPSSATTHD
jgi:hypothetical protein